MTHPPVKKSAPRRQTNGMQVTEAGSDGDVEELSLMAPPPPDGGWGWVVVFASFMIHIVADGVTYSFGIFFVKFLDYFQSSSGATSWVLSILVGVTLCSGPISSSLVNKYGCRPVTIAGALLGGVCFVISVFAPSVTFMYFSIGLGAGFGFGLIYLPAIVSVTCYFEKLRSLATGIAVCGSGLGTFIFAPLLEIMIEEYGWRGAMLLVAGAVLNCAIFGALFRPLQEKPRKQVAPKPVELELKTFDNKKAVRRELHDDWRHSVCNGDVPASGDCWEPTHSLLAVPTKMNSSSAHDITKTVSTSASGHLLPANPVNGHTSQVSRSEVARLAMSHPALLNPPPVAGQTKKSARPLSGVMARPDVFYRGSLNNIPLYRSAPRLNNLSRRGSLHEMNSTKAAGNHTDLGAVNRSLKAAEERDEEGCCLDLSPDTKETLREMLDFSLLRNPVFILFTISNFCTSVGFNVPYVYIVAQAEQLGIPTKQASLLLSVIGGANTVGRIILGYISDKTWVNRLMVYNVCLTVCGLGIMMSVTATDFTTLVLYCCVFGFTIGAYVGLTSVILVDLLGLEALTNAFGLLLLFQGIASLIGPPITGWLFDAFRSYGPGFLVSGATIAASGLMLFFIPALQRYLERKSMH